MTDIQICDYLREYLKIDAPGTPVTNLTVIAISGKQIQLSGSPGADHVWRGGVLELTSGDGDGERAIIMGNIGNILYLGNTFKSPPEVGDTVSVSGGPLGQARIYLFEPDSIEKAYADGIRYYVVISCTGGFQRQISLGGQHNFGISNKGSEYAIEIAAETPDITGEASAEEVRRITKELPTLKDQIINLLHWFKMQVTTRNTGETDIEYVYLSYQRTGSPRRLRGAILETKLEIV
jgi:hypothetical protein